MSHLILILLFIFVLQNTAVYGFSFANSKFSKSSLRMSSFDLDKAAKTLSKNKILTKTAQLGLLTRLEKAGFTLSSAIPLLKLADEQDLIGILEASSDRVLPLLAKGIELSPQLLPLAATALKASPSTLSAGAIASLGTALAVNYFIPDTSVGNIALETLVTVPLGIIVPGTLAVGSIVLSKLK